MTQPLHVIILAAGAGKRMKSALPKVLHESFTDGAQLPSEIVLQVQALRERLQAWGGNASGVSQRGCRLGTAEPWLQTECRDRRSDAGAGGTG